MCCLLSFKPALTAARQEEQMKILSLIHGADVKHARWARDLFFFPLFLRISILQNTGLFMCSISFTSWWQWKTVKIDALIKGTRGTSEKKRNSSAVGEKKVGPAAHVCLKANLQERHRAQRLLWEAGARNHLRSTDTPPTRASAPSAAAINV